MTNERRPGAVTQPPIETRQRKDTTPMIDYKIDTFTAERQVITHLQDSLAILQRAPIHEQLVAFDDIWRLAFNDHGEGEGQLDDADLGRFVRQILHPFEFAGPGYWTDLRETHERLGIKSTAEVLEIMRQERADA
jgi:hypothetical protein